MLDIANIWSTAAGIAFLLTLGSGVAAVSAVASIWRLRRDIRVIEAAENFAAVDLTTVVKRYVPAEHQTHVARDEMAFAKQAIAARRPRLKRLAAVFTVVLVCSVATAAFSVHRRLEMTASLTAQPRPSLDTLKVIEGVWGWRADFLLSCSENPQTIQVAPDRRTLTIRYAKPYVLLGSETSADLTFEVVSVKPNVVVLWLANPPAATKPNQIDVQFIDANTMSWSPSSNARVSTGAIERCPPSGPSRIR